MRPLPEFFRAISDDELPHLEAQKLRALRAIPLIVAVIASTDAVLEVATGRSIPIRTAANIGSMLATCTSAAVLTRRPVGKRLSDALLLLLSTQFMVATSLNGWMRGGRNELGTYAVFIPMAVSVFVPWRPRYTAALTLATLVTYAVTHALSAPIEVSPTMFVFVSFSVCLTSAVASQAQRRLWLQLEKARHQLAAADRMANLGRMTASIAHELKTPLAAAMNGVDGIRALADELGESVGHPQVTVDDLREIVVEMKSGVSVAEAGIQRAAQFIHAIRSQTLQMHEMQSAPFLVSEAISSAVTLLTHAIKRNEIEVDSSGVDPTLAVVGDASKFGQIVTNLLGNAVDASSKPGVGRRVTITASGTDAGVVVTVADQGPGVPAGLEERIFEPLFTTKADAEGTGLGLSISRDLAEGAFGGTLRLLPKDVGACFELRVPTTRSATAPVKTAAWVPRQAA